MTTSVGTARLAATAYGSPDRGVRAVWWLQIKDNGHNWQLLLREVETPLAEPVELGRPHRPSCSHLFIGITTDLTESLWVEHLPPDGNVCNRETCRGDDHRDQTS